MTDLIATLQAAAGNAAGEGLYVEEVFSTYLYTGNGSSQTITNGIDLDGEGGLVWSKSRNLAQPHILIDTIRGGSGAGSVLQSNATLAAYSDGNVNISSFTSTGYTIGAAGPEINGNNNTYASWTFRKAPKFFDVVTYTGTGSARTVSHNLGSVPGTIIIKGTDYVENWIVYHRSLGATKYIQLNTTGSASTSSIAWNDTEPTSTEFTVNTFNAVNEFGYNYVAYLFAHNDGDGEFGEDADQDIIKCGSYTGNGGSEQDINLGFEPQWLLVKNSSASADWWIVDAMRGFTVVGTSGAGLYANRSDAETTQSLWNINATGFTIGAFNNVQGNASGNNYIYIAIRRGPMKTPESGTEVFAMDVGDGSSVPGFTSNFPVDMALYRSPAVTDNMDIGSRLTGSNKCKTNLTDAETADGDWYWDYQNGWYRIAQSSSLQSWMFRRAPGFFDVVAYEGNGTAGRALSHNLGVEPELIIFKSRSNTYDWQVYHKDVGIDFRLVLNSSNNRSSGYSTLIFNDTLPTSSVITLGTWGVINGSGVDNIVYLFATLPGVSKVGTYTGNGTSQTIDCGFSAGARFVLIKSAVSSQQGDWHVFDTERGIISGNDPRLELNTTDAEDTGTDYIDPASSGFAVTSNSNVNTSGDTYIFLAIA